MDNNTRAGEQAMTKQFKIIRSCCAMSLERQVQEYLYDGWILHGGLTSHIDGSNSCKDRYEQAVVKEMEASNEHNG
jgi:hypothetical protein